MSGSVSGCSRGPTVQVGDRRRAVPAGGAHAYCHEASVAPFDESALKKIPHCAASSPANSTASLRSVAPSRTSSAPTNRVRRASDGAVRSRRASMTLLLPALFSPARTVRVSSKTISADAHERKFVRFRRRKYTRSNHAGGRGHRKGARARARRVRDAATDGGTREHDVGSTKPHRNATSITGWGDAWHPAGAQPSPAGRFVHRVGRTMRTIVPTTAFSSARSSAFSAATYSRSSAQSMQPSTSFALPAAFQ